MTVPANDATDLADQVLDSQRIHTVENRADVPGRWVKGSAFGHAFEALVFEEHATNPNFELDGSRISKLSVRHDETQREFAAFDRGWTVEPLTDEARVIVDVLAAGLADHVHLMLLD